MSDKPKAAQADFGGKMIEVINYTPNRSFVDHEGREIKPGQITEIPESLLDHLSEAGIVRKPTKAEKDAAEQ